MKQLAFLLLTLLAVACSPEPPLHLYDAHEDEL